MTGPQLTQNQASHEQIRSHLECCSASFIPPLSDRVDIAAYVDKLMAHAARFETWSGGELAGLLAVYCDAADRRAAFITNVSVLPHLHGKGIAGHMLERCIAHVGSLGFRDLELEVSEGNHAAVTLYERIGFRVAAQSDHALRMRMKLQRTEDRIMNPSRNYNREIDDTRDHQYAYRFDFDVMHPYMIRSFEPFFKQGNVLELGSFKGDFTKRLLDLYDDVTCVEASGDAIADAKLRLGDKPTYIHATFESVSLPRRYDNIILTHVLEHLDDPVSVLRRVNDEWLSDEGRLFLVCPNANAPSRQIATKMGLISHHSAVTAAEAAHGHRITYSLDTLERDATSAGLKVMYRSGIFFKALANFQWDRLLNTDIISRDYLDGCYMLGQQYPDLCASIFLMCEAGTTHE